MYEDLKYFSTFQGSSARRRSKKLWPWVWAGHAAFRVCTAHDLDAVSATNAVISVRKEKKAQCVDHVLFADVERLNVAFDSVIVDGSLSWREYSTHLSCLFLRLSRANAAP